MRERIATTATTMLRRYLLESTLVRNEATLFGHFGYVDDTLSVIAGALVCVHYIHILWILLYYMFLGLMRCLVIRIMSLICSSLAVMIRTL